MAEQDLLLDGEIGRPFFALQYLYNATSNSLVGLEFESIAPASAEGRRVPVWDDKTRRLKVGGSIIAEFPAQAKNVRAVLNEFERLGWADTIDDALEDINKDPKALDQVRMKLHNRQRMTLGEDQLVLEFTVTKDVKRIGWEWATSKKT